MADVSAEPTALCDRVDGNANEGTSDDDCSVSNSKSKQDVIEKLAHKNSSLPNGCLKHVLEENGVLKLMENTAAACEKPSDLAGGGDRDVCACQQQRGGLAHASVNDSSSVNDKSDATIRNVKNVSELSQGQHVDLDDCIDSIAKVNIVDQSEKTPSENVPASVCSELDVQGDLDYVVYESEIQMPDIMKLITKDLSEPYSIYTYRYFIHNWPKLCFLAMDRTRCVGAIVCKLDMHKKMVRRGYIAMLAVDQNYRRRGIGSHLVMKAIRAMVADECDEVVLETEITNKAALRLYENLGFVRDKRLFRYYLNGVDALRLKLWLR